MAHPFMPLKFKKLKKRARRRKLRLFANPKPSEPQFLVKAQPSTRTAAESTSNTPLKTF